MRVRRAAAVGAVVLALGSLLGCRDDGEHHRAPGSARCPLDDGPPVVARAPMRPTGEGGPNLDRELRVVRLPSGDLCVKVAVGGADTGPTVRSTVIDATRSGRTSRYGSAGDELLQVRLPGDACTTVAATQTVRGAGDRDFGYRARVRAGRGCPVGR